MTNYDKKNRTLSLGYLLIIISDNAKNGEYIKYGLQDSDLNAFYNIDNKKKDNLIKIEWNTTDKNYIKRHS